MTCEVISFSHLSSITTICPPSPHTTITPTHSRLHHQAWTGGGSVSWLLPTGRRCRPRRRAPPGPAALSPGPDRWWLRLPGLLPIGRRRRPRCRAPLGPAALSLGQDRWQLHLLALSDRASPSPPSPGPYLPGGAVAGPRPVMAPSPGSY
jgi:hypothetical protein